MDGQYFVLFLGGPVRLDDAPRDLHLFDAAARDVLERDVQVVLDRRVLALLLSVGRAVEVETVASEGATWAAWSRRAHAHVGERVHIDVHVAIEEHGVTANAATVQVEKGLERRRRAEELSECSSWISVEGVGVGLAAAGPVVATHAPLQPLLSVRVVDLALLLVGEHLIRLRDLLEPLLGARRLVLVRMVFQSQLTVRFLYLVIGRAFRNPQYFVVVFPHLDD